MSWWRFWRRQPTRRDAGDGSATAGAAALADRYRSELREFFTQEKLNELLRRELREADQTRHVQFQLRGDTATNLLMDEAIGRFSTQLGRRLTILERVDSRIHRHPLFAGFDRSIGDNTEMILKTLRAYLDGLPATDHRLRQSVPEGLTLQQWMRQIELSFASPARSASLFALSAIGHLDEWERRPQDPAKAKEAQALADEIDALVQELNTPGSQLEIR